MDNNPLDYRHTTDRQMDSSSRLIQLIRTRHMCLSSRGAGGVQLKATHLHSLVYAAFSSVHPDVGAAVTPPWWWVRCSVQVKTGR